MRALYIHDNMYFKAQTGDVYSQGQFPYEYWQPYLSAFNELVVMGRGQDLPDSANTDRLNISGGPRVTHALQRNINSVKDLPRNYWHVYFSIKKQVAQADCVIIRAVSDLGWIAFKHARKMGKPVAMEMVACAWDATWNHGHFLGKAYAPIRHMRDKKITKSADFVLYVSKNFLQSRYPTNGQVVSVSNVRIKPAPEIVSHKKIEHIKDRQNAFGPCTIGLIGNLNNRIKGVHDALEAMGILERERSGSFIFRHLGPGHTDKYERQAKELGIEGKVHFDGMLQTGDKVLKWLDDIDIYIQPSYQEGVPRALIEAMSRACPSIGSTAGGIPELLPDQWMHKPGDVNALAKLLIKMIDHPEEQIEAAYRNFNEAGYYVSNLLMPKREEFWQKFARFCDPKPQKIRTEFPADKEILRRA